MQTSPCPSWWEPSSQELRKGERKRKVFRIKAFIFLSILLLWRTAFPDRLLNFEGCDLLFSAVFLLHSSLDNIGGNARQDTAFLPSVFSTVSVGIFSGCPLTSFLPFKWLKPPSPSKYKPLGQAEVGPALLFPQDCSFFFFLLFTLNVQGPLASLLSQGGTAGRFLWTSLPRMCLGGASPMKPMIVMPGL